ncbi:MAG TPA: hypothetical protein VGT43_05335 [Burkholderiales bacterium]|nr:hypothetical protein [Burkholderiales bacterium]
MLARLARVFVAVALLAAGQSALLHPIEHVDELGEFVHLHGGHSDEGGQLLCDLLAALAACAAQTAAAVDAVASRYDPPAFPFSPPRLAERPPFRAHGPPAAA